MTFGDILGTLQEFGDLGLALRGVPRSVPQAALEGPEGFGAIAADAANQGVVGGALGDTQGQLVTISVPAPGTRGHAAPVALQLRPAELGGDSQRLPATATATLSRQSRLNGGEKRGDMRGHRGDIRGTTRVRSEASNTAGGDTVAAKTAGP